MKGTNALRQFQILLYKGLLLRKRHYIVTFTEIVIPIICACLPVMITSINSRPPNSIYSRYRDNSVWKNYTTYQPFDPFTAFRPYKPKMEFVYTPNNTITDKFMNGTVSMFQSKVLDGWGEFSKLIFNK